MIVLDSCGPCYSHSHGRTNDGAAFWASVRRVSPRCLAPAPAPGFNRASTPHARPPRTLARRAGAPPARQARRGTNAGGRAVFAPCPGPTREYLCRITLGSGKGAGWGGAPDGGDWGGPRPNCAIRGSTVKQPPRTLETGSPARIDSSYPYISGSLITEYIQIHWL